MRRLNNQERRPALIIVVSEWATKCWNCFWVILINSHTGEKQTSLSACRLSSTEDRSSSSLPPTLDVLQAAAAVVSSADMNVHLFSHPVTLDCGFVSVPQFELHNTANMSLPWFVFGLKRVMHNYIQINDLILNWYYGPIIAHYNIVNSLAFPNSLFTAIAPVTAWRSQSYSRAPALWL